MKSLALVLALLPTALVAQSATRPEPVLRGSGAFLALSVPDLGASVIWYGEKLGLAVVQRPPKQGPAAVAILEGGGLIVELIQYDGSAPRVPADPLLTQGFFKAGLIVDDLPRALETLRGRGVEVAFGPFPARDGQRANAILRDNAGNLIQVFGK